jgi:hypothetical protein
MLAIFFYQQAADIVGQGNELELPVGFGADEDVEKLFVDGHGRNSVSSKRPAPGSGGMDVEAVQISMASDLSGRCSR